MSHILFVNHTRQLHGSEQVLLQSMRVAHEVGHRVTLVLPNHVPSEGLDIAAQSVVDNIVYFPYRPAGGSWIRTGLVVLYNLRAMLGLVRYVKHEGVDVIYSNTFVSIVGLVVARIARRKHVWHFHETPDIRFGWNDSLKRYYKRWAGYTNNEIIFISKQQQGRWQQLLGNIPSQVIYNPIRMLSPKEHVSHEGCVIGYIGSLDERKNIAWLLRSFERFHRDFPLSRLKIVGARNREEIDKWKKTNIGLDSAVTIDMHTNDVEDFYSEIDILVLPSWEETMPLVVLESMQTGVAVVQTNRSGMSELLNDRRDTIFVDPSCEKSLYEALCELSDEGNRRLLSVNGLQKVRELNCNENFASLMRSIWV